MPELAELQPYDSISYGYDKAYFGTKLEGACLMVSYAADRYPAAKKRCTHKYK